MPYNVGDAYLRIIPVFEGIATTIDAEAKKWGRSAGRNFSESFNAAVSAQTRNAHLGPNDASSARQGADQGGAFARGFKSRVEAALKALPDVKLDADSSDVDRDIDAIRARLLLLSGKRINIDIDEADALREITAIQAELTALRTNSVSIQVDVDASRAMAELGAIQAQVAAVNALDIDIPVKDTPIDRYAAKIGSITGAVVGLAAIAGPLAGALSAVAAGAATTVGAVAGAGVVGGLGIAGIKNAYDLLTERQHQAARGNLAMVQQIDAQLALMSGSVVDVANKIRDDLGGAFRQLKNTAASSIAPGLSSFLDDLTAQIPALDRFVSTVGTGVSDMLKRVGDAMSGPAWQGFLDFITRVTGPVLSKFGDILGDLAAGFAGILEAFYPLTTTIGGAISDWTEKFREWSTGSGVQQFIAYIQQVGPVVASSIGALIGLVVHLTEAFSPLGVALLKFIDAVSKFVTALSPQALSAALIGLGLLGAAFGGPIAKSVGIALALAGAVNLVANNWDELSPALQPVLDLFGLVSKAIGGLLNLFGKLPAVLQLAFVGMIAFRVISGTRMFEMIATGVSAVVTQFTLLKGAGLAGIASGARAAGSALLGAFGGPVGLAIGGVITGVVLLTNAWKDAQPKVRDFTAAVDDNTGALADNAAQAAANAMSEDLLNWKKLGGDVGVYTAAVLGNAGAQRQMNDEVSRIAANMAKQSGVYADNASAFQQAGISQQEVLAAVSAGIMGNDDAWGVLVGRLNDAQVPFGDVNRANSQILGTFADLQPVLDQYQSNVKGLNSDLAKAQVEHEAAAGATRTMGAVTDAAADSWDLAGRAMAAAGGIANATASDVEHLSAAVQDQVNALLSLLNTAAQTRSAISGSITGFVSPIGAYQAAQQAANERVTGGGGGRRSTKSPAVVAAEAAVKAGRIAAEGTKKSAKAEQDAAIKSAKAIRDAIIKRSDADLKATKAAEKNAKDRVDAAKKEADELKRIADDAAKQATDAQARLESAQFAKRAADIALQAAQAGLAGAKSPAERASWERAVANALQDQATAASNLAQAQQEASQATQDAAASKQASEQATQKQTDAEAAYQAAQDKTAQVSEATSTRKSAADDAYTKAKEKADTRYQKSIDAVNSKLDALTTAQDKARTSAQTMSSGVSGATAKMVADVKPSFAQYMAELQKQVTAQERWKNNIISLASRVGPDIAIELAKMGPEAAPMIQMLANQTDEKLNKEWVPLFRKSTAQGTQDILDELTKALDPTGEKGLQLGNKVIDKLEEALKAAKDDPTAKAAILAVIDALQTTATNNPLSLEVKLKLAQAQADLERFTGDKGIASWAKGAKGGYVTAGGFHIPGAASGEWIAGGTPGKDSVLRWLMPGEAVIPTRYAQANRPLVDALMTGRDVSRGSQTTLYQTIYYPQAEPSSVSTNRALALAGALGGLS